MGEPQLTCIHKACISTIYIVITYILYHDSQLALLIATALDCLLLIACIVVATTVGKPLSYLSCPALPTSSSLASSTTGEFLEAVGHNTRTGLSDHHNSTKVDYFSWVETDRETCYEMKAVWGLSIALCVLFAFSSIAAGCIWRKIQGEAAPPAKDVEEGC